jgi:hypothetical protein
MSPHSKILLGLIILLISSKAYSQDSKELGAGYYVVVSAYAES